MSFRREAVLEDAFPEKIEDFLGFGSAVKFTFSRGGKFLASGHIDGTITIWSMLTRSVLKILVNPDDKSQVLSITWSECGQKIIVSTISGYLTLWSLETMKPRTVAVFNYPEVAACCKFNPANSNQALVCPIGGPPLVIDLGSGEQFPLPTSGKSCLSLPMAAGFSPSGKYAYLGTAIGEISVVKLDTRELIHTVHVAGKAQILELTISRNGKWLVCISSDKVVRAFELNEDIAREPSADSKEEEPVKGVQLVPGKEFRDTDSNHQWKNISMSGDGVYAAASTLNENKIYIWNVEYGNTVRILHGPKELISDLKWHPNEPLLGSATSAGFVYLWTRNHREEWSDLQPKFGCFDVNNEYVERESEFDLEEENDSNIKAEPSPDEVEEEVDVVTNEETEGSAEYEMETSLVIRFLRSEEEWERAFLKQMMESDPDLIHQPIEGEKELKGIAGNVLELPQPVQAGQSGKKKRKAVEEDFATEQPNGLNGSVGKKGKKSNRGRKPKKGNKKTASEVP